MKVEQARSEKSDAGRPDANVRAIPLQTPAGTAPKAVESANQGAFSKFLDAARETSESDRSKKPVESDGESSLDEAGENKKETTASTKDVEQNEQNESYGDGESGESSGWSGAPIPMAEAVSDTKTAVPPARAILHVADLERIVSAIRSDSFAGSKQVTIDLKNSVLDGLQIRITLTEQGNLKAEFLALNEQIKKQLEARKTEIESVLKDRSIKCSELSVALSEQRDEHALVSTGK